jgi:transposase
VSRPQVIDDQDHERIYERVAAIDVAKDTGMVCTRTPHPARPGVRRATVWTVKARMGAVRQLGRQLARDGIEIVTLESTSDYWRIWFFVLEACGLAVQLVAAAQVKALPGRPKTAGTRSGCWTCMSAGCCPAPTSRPRTGERYGTWPGTG